MRCTPLLTLSAALAFLPGAFAQAPIQVLQVRRPATNAYLPNHYSNDSNVFVQWHGNVALKPGERLWVRAFLGTPGDLRKMVAAYPASGDKCITFSFFKRIAIGADNHGLLLDEVFKRYPSDGAEEQDYALVFEIGPDDPNDRQTFKLSRADAKRYFALAIPLHISASPFERGRRLAQLKKLKEQQETVAQKVESIFVETVSAKTVDNSASAQHSVATGASGTCRTLAAVPPPWIQNDLALSNPSPTAPPPVQTSPSADKASEVARSLAFQLEVHSCGV